MQEIKTELTEEEAKEQVGQLITNKVTEKPLTHGEEEAKDE